MMKIDIEIPQAYELILTSQLEKYNQHIQNAIAIAEKKGVGYIGDPILQTISDFLQFRVNQMIRADNQNLLAIKHQNKVAEDLKHEMIEVEEQLIKPWMD